MSPPFHPALVHMPITFLLSASGADILTYALETYPTILAPVATYLSLPTRNLVQFMTLFSYILTIAGLVTAVPAVLTGGKQAVDLISARGLKANTVKMTFLHAILMDLSVAGAAYNWYTRRGVSGYMSGQVNALVSAAILAAVLFSADVGGKLVYEHGIGVSKIGQAKKGAASEKKEL